MTELQQLTSQSGQGNPSQVPGKTEGCVEAIQMLVSCAPASADLHRSSIRLKHPAAPFRRQKISCWSKYLPGLAFCGAQGAWQHRMHASQHSRLPCETCSWRGMPAPLALGRLGLQSDQMYLVKHRSNRPHCTQAEQKCKDVQR